MLSWLGWMDDVCEDDVELRSGPYEKKGRDTSLKWGGVVVATCVASGVRVNFLGPESDAYICGFALETA